jgi:hypothetical protein
MMTRFLSALLITVAALLAGCGSGGGGNSASPFAPGPGSGNLVIGASGLGAMSQANCANLSIVADGSSTVMNMSTPCTTATAVGTFVGGGAGNKAIVQLDGFDGLKVTDLGGIELDAKILANTAGTENFYMNFLIDLDCVKDEATTAPTIALMRDKRRIVVWQPRTGVVQPDGYTRYTTTIASNDWGMVPPGGRPTYGMATHTAANGPLAIAGFPNACIVDGISADGGMLRDQTFPGCPSVAGLPESANSACGLAHKGALILLGDSGNTAVRNVNIKRLKIKDRVITFQ